MNLPPFHKNQTAMDQNHNVTRTENGQPPPTSSCGPKVDKAKLAGKGADLLHTASSFGKGKKLGKYLGKAENYLRKYQNTHSTNTPHGYPGPANTVPPGHPPTSAHHGDPGLGNAVPLGHPPALAHHGEPGPANTIPLSDPPTSAHHGDPSLANTVPLGHPHTLAHHGDPGLVNTVPLSNPPTSAHHGDLAGPANTVPLGHPPTLAHHGYPPSPTEAPHGHQATTTVPPAGYPPARWSNSDYANAVPIAYPATFGASTNMYPSTHPGGNGHAGGVHGNSGSGFGDYLKKASGFLKKY